MKADSGSISLSQLPCSAWASPGISLCSAQGCPTAGHLQQPLTSWVRFRGPSPPPPMDPAHILGGMGVVWGTQSPQPPQEEQRAVSQKVAQWVLGWEIMAIPALEGGRCLPRPTRQQACTQNCLWGLLCPMPGYPDGKSSSPSPGRVPKVQNGPLLLLYTPPLPTIPC